MKSGGHKFGKKKRLKEVVSEFCTEKTQMG